MSDFIFSPSGEQENIDKFSKRLVKVTKQHNDECKNLLTLMGVPYIEVRPEAGLLHSCLREINDYRTALGELLLNGL